jgi:outer membrane protein TolC
MIGSIRVWAQPESPDDNEIRVQSETFDEKSPDGTDNVRFTLEACQAFARENYPFVKQYGLIRQSTEYSVANVVKAYLPQVALSAQASYQSDVAAFPQEMTNLYEQIGIDFKGLNKDQYKVALEVNQMIWDGGFTRAQKEVSSAEGNVSAQSVETEIYTLRERINQLYFGILVLDAQLQQNVLFQTLLQSNCKTVEACVNNGIAMQSDLHAVEAELLSVAQLRVRIESAADAYRQMLSIMIGKKIDDSAWLEKPDAVGMEDAYTQFKNESIMLSDSGSALSDERNHRPELALFDAQSAQFEAQKRAVKATTMPRFGLFAQGFYGNPGLNLFKDMTEDKWTWNYIAGIRMQWNFGSLYTKKGTLRKLSVAQRQIDNRRETFLFNNRLQQVQQRHAINQMRRVMRDDEEIIRLRTSVRQASEAKYANGTSTINDLLRDITAENQASLNKSLNELEWLQRIYEWKNTINNR